MRLFHTNESGNIITCEVVPMDVVGSEIVVVWHEGEATGKMIFIIVTDGLSIWIIIIIIIIVIIIIITFEIDNRWVHLGASRTTGALGQTGPTSSCRSGLCCGGLRTRRLFMHFSTYHGSIHRLILSDGSPQRKHIKET